MKIHFLKFSLLFIVLPLALMACDSGGSNRGGAPLACNLSAGPSSPNVALDVEFTATLSGGGTISQISYTVGTTTSEVSNPTLPWSVTVMAAKQDAVSITAAGTVRNGLLRIGFEGSTGGGGSSSSISGSDSCTQIV